MKIDVYPAKIRCFGRISAAIEFFSPKQKKLELPQRVEHVCAPLESLKTRFWASKLNFTVNFTLDGGKIGVPGGQKWPKSLFFQIDPGCLPDG